MRFPEALEQYRFRTGPWSSGTGDDFGAFKIPGPAGEALMIIASPGDANENVPWEHVSVSTRHRCPTWKEMCYIKDIFWDEEEPVMQLHPPKSTWINNHPYCLHLWRPVLASIPLPPQIAVGFKALNLSR
jgi:hypothetical protein